MGNPFSRCLQRRPRDPRSNPKVQKLEKRGGDLSKQVAETVERKRTLEAGKKFVIEEAKKRLPKNPKGGPIVLDATTMRAVQEYNMQIGILNTTLNHLTKSLQVNTYTIQGLAEQEVVLLTAENDNLAADVLLEETHRSRSVVDKRKKTTKRLVDTLDMVKESREEQRSALGEMEAEEIDLGEYEEWDTEDALNEQEPLYASPVQKSSRYASPSSYTSPRHANPPSRYKASLERQEPMDEVDLLESIPEVPSTPASQQTQLHSLVTL